MEMRIVPCPGPRTALGRDGRRNGPGRHRAMPFSIGPWAVFNAAASWAP